MLKIACVVCSKIDLVLICVFVIKGLLEEMICLAAQEHMALSCSQDTLCY